MTAQVPFIDRDKELALIEEAIGEWGTRRIICIQAEGGIGKTRLLQEVQKRHIGLAPSSMVGARRTDTTIALIQEFTDSEWSQQFIAGARDTARHLDVKLVETDANFDLVKMASDLRKAVEKSPDAIVVSLGSNANLQSQMQAAVDSGIKVLTLDNYTSGVDGLTSRVTQDDYKGARNSLELMAKDIDYRGKIVAVWLKGARPLERRKTILDAVLSQYPDIELVEEFGAWGEEVEEQICRDTKEVLERHPDIQAIWVTWNKFAQGVVRALTEAQRTDISVYSFDLCPSDIETMIQPNSPWKATIAADPYGCGQTMVRLATIAARGGRVSRHYSIPMKLFTQESLRRAIDEDQPLWEESAVEGERTQLTSSPFVSENGVLVTRTIDFDDHAYHISQNVGRRIAEMIGRTHFQPYFRGLADYRKMEEAGISRERLAEEVGKIDLVFADCFNAVTAHQRVILCLDTVEKVEGTDVWNYILNLSGVLENVVALVAGRNAEGLYEELATELGEDIQLIDLPALPPRASESYLQAKQNLLHSALEPELAQKVLFLASGRPILIDLAVEWLAREIPLPWLVESDMEELKSLSDEAAKKHQKEFEKHLVRHIGKRRRPSDWLFLAMARVYPLDVGMVAKLLDLSTQEAKLLFDEVKDYVFVKSLPGERITLHDEMRRMIRENVWPEIDRYGHRQRRDSRLAVEYLQNEVQGLRNRIRQLKSEEKDARRMGRSSRAHDVFIKREALEREMWVLEEQRLAHQLFVDLDEGVNIFVDLFDQATEEYYFSYREVLMNVVQPVTEELSPTQRYEVGHRRVQYLIDEGRYLPARDLATELREGKLTQEQQSVLLMQLGDIENRQGNFERAVDLYRQASEICRDARLDEQLIRAEKGQGYGYRLLGNGQGAHTHYLRALKLALNLSDKKQQALLSNNLAFLHTLRPITPSKALQMSDRAIELCEELGLQRELGAAYNTRASILYRFGRYNEALNYFEEAERVFEPEDDWEWLSRVYSWRGVTYWAMARFDEDSRSKAPKLLELARDDLEMACKHIVPRDEAMTLNRLARVYSDLHRYDEAAHLAQKSYELAREAHDRQYEIVAVDMLARLALSQDNATALPEIKGRVALYEQAYPNEQRDNVTLGRVYSHLGTLALKAEDFEEAIRYYKDGFVLVARHSGYGWISLPGIIRRLEKTVFSKDHPGLASPQFIQHLGETLSQVWEEEELDAISPEVLPLFARWQHWPE